MSDPYAISLLGVPECMMFNEEQDDPSRRRTALQVKPAGQEEGSAIRAKWNKKIGCEAPGREILSRYSGCALTRTTVILEKPSSKVGGRSFCAMRCITSSGTMRSRRWLRAMQTSTGTSK